jgi:tRNA pseudouridine38-40 synthase
MAVMPLGVKNTKLTIEYDGTEFCGWQKQPRVRTVEGEITGTLASLVGSEPELIAAARTDSGVHALAQIANYSSLSSKEPEEIKGALNSLLPPDVRILGVEQVPLDFNARFDAKRRTYRYLVSMKPTSVWRRHRWYVRWQLDVDAIRLGMQGLVGEHDFTAYTCKDEDRSPRLTVESVSVEEVEPGVLALGFTANRFLRRMVRMLTGTFVEIGRGKMQPGDAYAILASRDRALAGPCAPPHGLYLVGVDY